MVTYFPSLFPKNGNTEQTLLRVQRADFLLEQIIDSEKDLSEDIFNVEKEILENDKPNIWNVHIDSKNNMERVLEVEFQKYALAVTEDSSMRIEQTSVMTFYSKVLQLKEKYKK